MSFWKTN